MNLLLEFENSKEPGNTASSKPVIVYKETKKQNKTKVEFFAKGVPTS